MDILHLMKLCTTRSLMVAPSSAMSLKHYVCWRQKGWLVDDSGVCYWVMEAKPSSEDLRFKFFQNRYFAGDEVVWH